MKKLSIITAAMLFAINSFAQDIDKPSYIKAWVDSLNNISPGIVWFKMSPNDSLKMLYVSKDVIDYDFGLMSKAMIKNAEEELLNRAEQLALIELSDQVVRPALINAKTREQRDEIVRKYPEFFSSDLDRLGITLEMVEQVQQERKAYFQRSGITSRMLERVKQELKAQQKQ
jgi:hypothetical protein